MTHPTSVGELSVKRVAELMSGLRYDAMADFLRHLSDEVLAQSDHDRANGRPKLGGQLYCAFIYIRAAGNEMAEAWKVAAPHEWDGPAVPIGPADVPTCSKCGADATDQVPCHPAEARNPNDVDPRFVNSDGSINWQAKRIAEGRGGEGGDTGGQW